MNALPVPPPQPHPNEVVVDVATYLHNLPYSVEAILGSTRVHDALLRRYQLTRQDVPLVTFDGARFTEVV